jgi:methylthioribose-1-phosphate isomerase
LLKDTEYPITIIPDVCAGNLIYRKLIDKVIMGAQSIYFNQGKPVSFVNTCGSVMIALVSEKYDIPFFIVAESAKFIHLKENEQPQISYKEEVNIFTDEEQIVLLKADRLQGVSNRNVGHDLCPFSSNMTIISEKDCI